MNKIRALIENIETIEGITKVVSRFWENSLKAITLELPQNIEIGKEAFFVFKETEVGITKNLVGEISFSNIYEGNITELIIGKMLTKVVISCDGITISSIITTDATKRLDLKLGDTVKAFVKATEVSMEAIN